jgi:hypothetical protein
MSMAVEETTISQGSQWRIGEVRVGIVRVGEYGESEAAELLLRDDSEVRHALVTVDGREEEFAGWTFSLLWTVRPADPAERETVRLRARRSDSRRAE